jgi:dipeptidyl aminopeptidase/acylaminoacyl peptidase
VRVAIAIVAACLLAGCGAATKPGSGPTKATDAGVLVFGGTMNPSDKHPPGGIYAMRPDGSALEKLAFSSDVGYLTFSADSRMAAMSDESGRVLVSRADGSGRRVVPLPADSYEQSAAISPDGKRVALVYGPNPDAPVDVWTVSVDGSGLRRLTSTGNVSTAAWSPDGKRIAFTDQAELPEGDYEPGEDVYVVRADGTNIQRIGGYASGYWRPAWSPDGTRIAFDDLHERIKVIDLESKSANVVLKDGQAPVWSPDGKRIAVLRIAPCHGYVACMWSKMIVFDPSDPKSTQQVGPTFGEPTSFAWTTADVDPRLYRSRSSTGRFSSTPSPSSAWSANVARHADSANAVDPAAAPATSRSSATP